MGTFRSRSGRGLPGLQAALDQEVQEGRQARGSTVSGAPKLFEVGFGGAGSEQFTDLQSS